jgi:hypothetical protein
MGVPIKFYIKPAKLIVTSLGDKEKRVFLRDEGTQKHAQNLFGLDCLARL